MRKAIPSGHARALGAAVVILLSTAAVITPRAQQRRPQNSERVNGRDVAAGRLIVKLRDEATAADLSDIDAQADADVDRPIGNGRVRLLHSKSKQAAQLLAELRLRQEIEYVEPDYVVHATDTPNDPAFGNQWGLNNTGQSVNGTAGTQGADVHAAAAWTLARGSANTVVGIVDGGFDVTHFDLAPNVWSAPRAFSVNVGGIPVSCPAGAHGAVFETSIRCDPTYDGAADHATHVAGIAGAAADNGLGIAGASWHASLMSLNFLTDGSNGFTSDAINAIEFAIQVKATFAGTPAGNIRILNNSWGSGAFSQALQDEIDRAGASDILFVAAAGNGTANTDSSPYYPGSLNRPNELTVAASAPDDSLAWFSNYSRNSVHLAAPGTNIFSTLTGGQLGYMSGTSMATPFVSGAAALVLSRCALNTADLKALLVNTVDLRPAFASTTVSGGRLNMEAALQACTGAAGNVPPSVSLSAPLDGTTVSQGQAVRVAANAADTDGSIARVDFFAGASLVASATTEPYAGWWPNAAPGTYALTAVATDDAGAQTRSEAATVRIGPASGNALPSPWQHVDVGSTGAAGSASYAGGTFSVSGAGSGIAAAASDSFQYVYEPLTDDGEIVAHVASLANTGSGAQGGVVIRGSLGDGASEAALDLRSDGSVEFVGRAADGQQPSTIGTQTAVTNVWLKLTRLQTTVYGYTSPDGVSWHPLGKVILASAPTWVGLGVSSRTPSAAANAAFDNIAVVGGAAPSSNVGSSLPSSWISSDVGQTGQPGHASASGGVFTVSGAGSDIWGASDSFQYVNQNASGDFTLTARVVDAQNTSTFAKAGIMLRTSLDPAAANVTLDIRPDGAVEFTTRSADGGSQAFLGTATRPFPGWLRLARSGSTVTASVSPDGSSWSAVGTTSFSAAGVLAGLAVCSHATSTLDAATFDNVSIAAGSATPALPAPWTSTDIGATGQAGGASASNGVFTLSGAGSDIWGTADSFQYVSQPVSGDLSLVARLTGEQNTSPYAKAGLMLRKSSAANAANVVLDRVPGGGFEFMTRASDGASETFLATTNLPLPAWVRLVVSGGTVTAAVSADGSQWTTLGSTSFAYSSALAGLLVCSHSTAALNTSTFDNVALAAGATALPAPWISSDVGQTGVAGNATFASGAFTVKGAGADIWGTSDSFQFVNQAVSGDFTLTARVSNQQNTSTYAKAGIMLRDSLSDGGANVVLDMRPSGDFEFMSRSADGVSESYLGTAKLPAPAWVRLERTGSTVTASVSADGAAWTTIGGTSFSSSSALAGLVVCSHTTSALSSAMFDNVSVAAGEP